MTYFKIIVNTPFCGTETEEYIECKTITEAESIAEELCRTNAEGYEYLASGWDDEYFEDMTEEEQTEAIEDYYADCDWDIEEVSAEEYSENIS